jgi:hypothetical protein
MTAHLPDFSESVLAKLKTLPLEQQQQVSDFIEFLVSKYRSSQSIASQPSRVMGLFEGKGWISEDFNEPLPDEFWEGKL